ncbi:MAG: SRPBCC family protein [Jatrophihabitans sp.]|uniref:SRPBCC family protein n=1 Tax=Jatrophihabitans sp. TaxID=1932789 RepID=UPI003F80664B
MTITIERTVRTARPVGEVAKYLSDFRTTAQWDPHTKSCKRTDSGPLRVGSEFDNTQSLGPLTTTLHYRVVSLDEGRSISLRSEGGAVTATDSMRFDEQPDGGTLVTYRAEFEFAAPLRPLEPVLRRLLEKVGDDGKAGMERALEQLPVG